MTDPRVASLERSHGGCKKRHPPYDARPSAAVHGMQVHLVYGGYEVDARGDGARWRQSTFGPAGVFAALQDHHRRDVLAWIGLGIPVPLATRPLFPPDRHRSAKTEDPRSGLSGERRHRHAAVARISSGIAPAVGASFAPLPSIPTTASDSTLDRKRAASGRNYKYSGKAVNPLRLRSRFRLSPRRRRSA